MRNPPRFPNYVQLRLNRKTWQHPSVEIGDPVTVRATGWIGTRPDTIPLMPPFAASYFSKFARVNKIWRKRVGVEPKSEAPTVKHDVPNGNRRLEVLHSDLERILVSVLVSLGLLFWGNRRHVVTARDFRIEDDGLT